MDTGSPSWVERSERQAYNSPLPSDDVRNAWSYTSTYHVDS